MKKYILIFFVLCCFFVDLVFVNADCDDLSKNANKIKVRKIEEFADAEAEDPYHGYIGLEISNIPENMYVVITNDYNDVSTTVNSSDLTNGVYRYPSPYVYKIVNYEIKVYSKDASCSSTDSLKVFETSSRILNSYFFENVCLENRDLELCKPMLDEENLDVLDFYKKIDKAIELKNATFLGKIWKFIKKYYLYILIPFILISLISIIRIILIKKGMKNE